MIFKIKSKKLDQEIEFFKTKYYVFANFSRPNKTVQLCGKAGDTIMYGGDNQEKFETICKAWYKNFIKSNSFESLA